MKSLSTIDDLSQVEKQIVEKDQDQDIVSTNNSLADYSLQVVTDQQNNSGGGEMQSIEEMLQEITFEEYFKHVNASVRLRNSILAQIEKDQFPYANLADYYFGTQDHKDKIDKIPSFGNTSRNELDNGINELIKDEDRMRMICLSVISNSQTKHSDDPVLGAFFQITLNDFVETADVRVRTKNSIMSNQESSAELFPTLGDYYSAPESLRLALLDLPNFGAGSKLDLDKAIENIIADNNRLALFVIQSGLQFLDDEDRSRLLSSSAADPYQKFSNDPITAAFFQISLHDFAKIAPLMVRTKNSITGNPERVETYFPTVGDYYSAPDLQKRELLKIPNFGKGSKKDLDQTIENFVSDRDRLAFFVNHAGQHGIDIGEIPAGEQYEPQASLLLGVGERVRQILTIQELNVLKLRLVEGLFLENIGKLYDLTRERIRQIEASSLNKLRMTLMPEVTVFKKRITEILSKTKGIAEYEKTQAEYPEIDAFSFEILFNLLDEKDGVEVTLKKGILWRGDRYLMKKEIYHQIDKEFLSCRWPVRIPLLALQLPEIPLFLIERRLKSKYNASIENGVIHSASKLTNGQLARFALRELRVPSHHSTVYKKICTMFDTHVTARAVESELGKSKNIVIVGLGTYALYETLWLDEDDIQQIRGDVFHYLSEKGEYVRSPHIFDALFKGIKFSGREINPYIVLGVLQNDENFRTTTGLLIGLSHFGDTYQITDVIRDLVREHGPIHIDKISKLLPKSRRIGKEAISTILLSDDNLVRQKYGTYDTVERVLGSKEEMDSLLADIRYQLRGQELESGVIFEYLVKNRHPKLTENALKVLLRRHFKKDKETGCFYAD